MKTRGRQIPLHEAVVFIDALVRAVDRSRNLPLHAVVVDSTDTSVTVRFEHATSP